MRARRASVVPWLVAVVMVASAACADKPRGTTPPASPPDSAVKPPPASALRDPHRFDCAADAECMNSCKYGAVNAAWYARSQGQPDFRECEDGCANQVSAPPRCEQQSCVAYQFDPRDPTKISRSDHCTKVER